TRSPRSKEWVGCLPESCTGCRCGAHSTPGMTPHRGGMDMCGSNPRPGANEINITDTMIRRESVMTVMYDPRRDWAIEDRAAGPALDLGKWRHSNDRP